MNGSSKVVGSGLRVRKGKDKEIQLQALTDPERPDFKTIST
jgi:hypothetical protein